MPISTLAVKSFTLCICWQAAGKAGAQFSEKTVKRANFCMGMERDGCSIVEESVRQGIQTSPLHQNEEGFQFRGHLDVGGLNGRFVTSGLCQPVHASTRVRLAHRPTRLPHFYCVVSESARGQHWPFDRPPSAGFQPHRVQPGRAASARSLDPAQSVGPVHRQS
jgi:hypothetical protein